MNHSEKQLKDFAITLSWAFPLFFSLIIPWLFGFEWQMWPLGISITLLSLYVVNYKLLIYPYNAWMKVAGVIGWINTRIILGLCFYALIMPIGFIMRTLNKLDYKVRSRAKNSNYVKVEKKEHNNLENPF